MLPASPGQSTMKWFKSELATAALGALALTLICLIMGVWTAPYPATGAKIYWLAAAGDMAKLLTFTLGVPAVVLAFFNHRRSLKQQAEDTVQRAAAVAEQKKANLWKRREYVAKTVADLETNASNRFAMTLLDYNARRMKLPGSDILQRFDDDDLVLALAPIDVRGRYSQKETAIRDCFDSLFNALDRLGVMVEAGLLEWDDLYPYIGYWLELLGPGQRKRPPAYSAAIRLYVDDFYFENLAALMVRAKVPVETTSRERGVVAKRVAQILNARQAKAASGASPSRDADSAPLPGREEEGEEYSDEEVSDADDLAPDLEDPDLDLEDSAERDARLAEVWSNGHKPAARD